MRRVPSMRSVRVVGLVVTVMRGSLILRHPWLCVNNGGLCWHRRNVALRKEIALLLPSRPTGVEGNHH